MFESYNILPSPQRSKDSSAIESRTGRTWECLSPRSASTAEERHLDLLYICSGGRPSVQLLAKYIMGRLDRPGRTFILIMQCCPQQCSSFLAALVSRSWQCYGSRRARLLVAGFWGGDCYYSISRPGSGCEGVPVKAHSGLSVLFIALWSISC